MKYRIEYRSSRYEGEPGSRYVTQSLGGNFYEFEAVDDADAQAQLPAQWQALIVKATKAKLHTIGYVGLERVPDATPVAVECEPPAA
ncbi:hypothetical protein FJY93_04740 [Candidatus Kaiserbacteria bacterium]|nr:hypothetical protein [Candidatus Kaiserbacteria bacterium]